MSGRRSHPRFAAAQAWDGAVRILRDVMVHAEPDGRLLALGTIGAFLILLVALATVHPFVSGSEP